MMRSASVRTHQCDPKLAINSALRRSLGLGAVAPAAAPARDFSLWRENLDGRIAFYESGEVQMRSFILACIAIVVVSSAGAAILRHLQISAEQAFSSTAVRL
jgi:hypothetical protein